MIAVKDMQMPNYCTEVIEKENKGGWISASVKRCPLYNVCKEKETIRSNFKPVSCPLVEIVTCKDCKYCDFDDSDQTFFCNIYGNIVCSSHFCSNGERRK